MSRSASESRYYEERPCEHGNQSTCDHIPTDYRDGGCFRLDCDVFHAELCPGGVRREITIDYAEAWKKLQGRDELRDAGRLPHSPRETELAVRAIIEAALGETGE